MKLVIDVGSTSIAEAETQLVLRTLDFTNGQKKRAAKILGISRARLYRVLKRISQAVAAPPQEDPDQLKLFDKETKS